MITKEELRGMSLEEINKILEDSQNIPLESRIKIDTGQEKDTSKQKKNRRFLALLKTLKKEKELATKAN